MNFSNESEAPPPYQAYNVVNQRAFYQQEAARPIYSTDVLQQSPSPILQFNQPALIASVPIMIPILDRVPVSLNCPRCQANIVTVVTYESGAGTWLTSFLICLFGGIFGCCLIPFCVPSLQDVVHWCPLCLNVIGRRNCL